ncbi:hypothetical protein HQQ94_11345 [Shewanella sp. VB17]|nr:hypothetical protein [Shewanella sp. VB17]NRD73822.1 hypothetical protein [Shewanella sp. VB17]
MGGTRWSLDGRDKSGEMIQTGRWEIVFGAGKMGDALPVIKHALYK